MVTRHYRRFALVLAILAVTAAAAGCGGKKPATEEPTTPTVATPEDNALGDSDSGKALGLQSINFPYDAFVLTDEAKATLKANAGIMNDKKTAKIQIEGHCDQRGGIQYNIALGEKRAGAVKKYLQDIGVSGDRITTISYGKERPLDQGQTEDAYAKNRRANFVITSR